MSSIKPFNSNSCDSSKDHWKRKRVCAILEEQSRKNSTASSLQSILLRMRKNSELQCHLGYEPSSSSSPIRSRSFRHFTETLPSSEAHRRIALHQLVMSLWRLLMVNGTLKELHLCLLEHLEPHVLRVLSKGLQSQRCLQVLSLQQCTEDVVTILEHLEGCNLPQELQLQGGKLGTKGMDVLSSMLCQQNHRLSSSSLQTITIKLPLSAKEAGVLGDSLCRNQSLRRLRLIHALPTGECVRRLLRGIAFNDTLETLELRDNSLERQGTEAVSTLLTKSPPSLKSILLPFNRVDDDGTAVICRGMMRNSTLETVDLSHNFIGSQGCSAIATMVCSSVSVCAIKCLDLRSNRMSSESVHELIEALISNTRLQLEELLLWNAFVDNDEGKGISLSKVAALIMAKKSSLREVSFHSFDTNGCTDLQHALLENRKLTGLFPIVETMNDSGDNLHSDEGGTSSNLFAAGFYILRNRMGCWKLLFEDKPERIPLIVTAMQNQLFRRLRYLSWETQRRILQTCLYEWIRERNDFFLSYSRRSCC